MQQCHRLGTTGIGGGRKTEGEHRDQEHTGRPDRSVNSGSWRSQFRRLDGRRNRGHALARFGCRFGQVFRVLFEEFLEFWWGGRFAVAELVDSGWLATSGFAFLRLRAETE